MMKDEEGSEVRQDMSVFERSTEVMGSTKPLGESLLEIATIIARWRRFIIIAVVVPTVITTIVALLLPKWYKSTASVFPAQQTSLFPGLEGVSSLVQTLSGGKKLGGLAGPSEADRYIAILKSDRVIGAMIQKFNLIELYGYDGSSYPNEKTAKELVDNTVVEVQDEGNLTITVYDKDPQRAAVMVNYYVHLLNETNSELLVQNARGNREFIEARYQKNLKDLRDAEEAMKAFQIKYGVLAVPEQAEVTIKAGAELYGKLAVKEIELSALRRIMSESHPSVFSASIEIDEIKKKMKELNAGSMNVGDNVNILIPFRQAPELASKYIRLYRDAQIQNKILEFLTPLYEQAKVEEKRNTPSVVVLDSASVPERKSKPKITLFALLSFVISLTLSLFVVFLAEAFHRLQRMYPERVTSLFSSVQSDWLGLRSTARRNRRGTQT